MLRFSLNAMSHRHPLKCLLPSIFEEGGEETTPPKTNNK